MNRWVIGAEEGNQRNKSKAISGMEEARLKLGTLKSVLLSMVM